MNINEMEIFISRFLGIPHESVKLDQKHADAVKRSGQENAPIRHTTGDILCFNIPIFGRFFNVVRVQIDMWFTMPAYARMHIELNRVDGEWIIKR